MKKFIATLIASFAITLLTPLAAFAHVVVTPDQVLPGKSTSFNLSVPNERDVAVNSVRLLIPKNVNNVQPDVMGGWTITTEKSDDTTLSITWTGIIPVGQRADFSFKAQAPASNGELDWKAYQTYADNTLVSWDQKPTATETDNDDATTGPYSVTKVSSTTSSDTTVPDAGRSNILDLVTLGLSIIAIVMSLFALVWRTRK